MLVRASHAANPLIPVHQRPARFLLFRPAARSLVVVPIQRSGAWGSEWWESRWCFTWNTGGAAVGADGRLKKQRKASRLSSPRL
jgi:hypothetical protein